MINNEIKAHFVNVVNNETKGLTKMTLADAIKLAEETDEDVVLLNDKADIPVVKICDYKKMLYEKQKKEKENKKKSRLSAQTVKEIQISDAIAAHDMEVKAKNIDRILTGGDKVKLVIKYKGRSIRFISNGASKIQSLANMVTVKYNIDKTPSIEGNSVSMIISPSKN